MTYGQLETKRADIERIIERAHGRVGVAIIDPEHGDTMLVLGHDHFPMQSVFKFPLALEILHQIENGKYSLDQLIHIKESELHSNTWSPLKKKYPSGDADIPLAEIIRVTVAESDNNGCDILFRLAGGPAVVNEFIHTLGIADISIVATEEAMHADASVQYRNWCTPLSATQLLCAFFRQQILSAEHTNFLRTIMVNTATGAKRIKGKLPADAVVAHKTGSSGADEKGIAAATNDIGIITLPNGRSFMIAVFITNSSDDENFRDSIIADITKAAWDGLIHQ